MPIGLSRRFAATVAAGACLLLGGCIFPPGLTSERIRVPLAARWVEPGFEGTFWVPEFPAASSAKGLAARYRVVSIHRDAQRRYTFTSHDETGGETVAADEMKPIYLLRTRNPGIDVMVGEEGGRMLYMFAVLSRGGTWVMFPFMGDLAAPVDGVRETWLAQAARRHGLNLRDGGESYDTVIEGKLDAGALAALFSDPAVLAGLRFDPDEGMRLFPASGARVPDRSDRAAWWPTDYVTQLTTAYFPLGAAAVAAPAGLAGDWTDALGGRVSFVRGDDGSYAVLKPAEPHAEPAVLRRLRFLPTIQKGLWLALEDQSESTDAAQSGKVSAYACYWVDIGQAGVMTLAPIRYATYDFSRVLAGIAGKVRDEAAARHGLTMKDGRLAGALDAAAVTALLGDPQFLVGLVPAALDDPLASRYERAQP